MSIWKGSHSTVEQQQLAIKVAKFLKVYHSNDYNLVMTCTFILMNMIYNVTSYILQHILGISNFQIAILDLQYYEHYGTDKKLELC